MSCRFCKSALAAGVTVCPQCGAPQPTPAPAAPKPRRRQVEFRVSWGEPLPDLAAPPPAVPLVAHQAPPPYAAHAPWPQRQMWMPAPGVRSFRWQAFIALVLYFPFFLPGLVANIIWWNQARSLEAATGVTPRGKGCLTVMLVCAIGMLLLWVGVAGLF